MELTYLGHSSFKMKFKNGMVLIADPFSEDFPKQKADLVTMSCGDKEHNFVAGISGPVKREDVFVVSEEGEYEVGGVEVITIKEGKNNLIMVIRQNGISTCHLGNLSTGLSEKEIDRIGSVDILLVPVGVKLGDLISNMSPSIVVPMKYTEKELAEFLDSSGLEVMQEESGKVKIDVNTLPENTKCLVLKSHLNQ
jgi:L-ascorbate metabolism protein UlaG (beta-lactamase superfamily)